MSRKETALKRIILCVTALSLLLSLGCGKREDKVVAKVGDRKITIGQFEKASETMEEKYLPVSSDLAGKKELLDHMINKEVMALKALSAGYEKDEAFVTFWNRYKAQYLVAAMENEFILKKVTVTDEETKNYFDQMHKEYTLSQIVLADENQALEVRAQLFAGADFAELARKYSLSRDSEVGGSIGPSNIGEMFWWIEEALFSMKEGEISQPLPSSSGYVLIKVHGVRQIQPDKDLDWAGKRVRAVKEKKLLMDLKKKIEKEIGLVIYTDAVDIVYSNLPPDINFGDLVEGRVNRENAPKLEIPEQYQAMLIAQYADSSYTLEDYLAIYEALGLPERPRREYGKEHIVESIHKRIWDIVLPVYAEQQLKVQNIPEVAKGLQEKKEMFLVYTLYNDQVRKDLIVTEDDVRQYYDEHQSEIASPEERDFGLILVGSKAAAEEVAKLARAGGNWGKLAAKHSEDSGVKENGGRMGMHPRGHYADYDRVIFSLGAGEISDPFEVPRGWAVATVFAIKQPEPVPFEEAKQSIQNKISEERAEKILMEKLATWRKNYTVDVNEGNLKKAELKRTRPTEPSGEPVAPPVASPVS